MIAEQREQSNSTSQLINALMKYMRQECNVETLDNPSILGALYDKLMMHAKQFNAKRGVNMDSATINECINTTIKRFRSNWADKVPGEDDRGHRFGKMATASPSTYNVVNSPESYKY